jgi:hypothetical protein
MSNQPKIRISSSNPPILTPFIPPKQRILSENAIIRAINGNLVRRRPSIFDQLVRRNNSLTSKRPPITSNQTLKNVSQTIGVSKNENVNVKNKSLLPTPQKVKPSVFNRNTKLVDKRVKRKKNDKIGIITKSTVKPGSSSKKANVSVLYNGSKFPVFGTYPNNFNDINNSAAPECGVAGLTEGCMSFRNTSSSNIHPLPPPKNISPGSYISGIGLVNFSGAACYSLSAMQLLFSIPEIRTTILKNNNNNNNPSLNLIKGIFTELNKSITTFESVIPNKNGLNLKDYLDPLIRSCGLDPRKQESTEEFLISIIDRLGSLNDIFNVYYDISIESNDPKYKRPINTPQKRDIYQMINLNTDSEGTFSIQQLIDNTNIINHGDFSDCGPRRFLLNIKTSEKAIKKKEYINYYIGNIVPENFNINSTEFRITTSGKGIKTEKYIIPEGNKYLLLKIVKDESVPTLNNKGNIKMKTISKNIKIDVNPIIIIEDNRYALYGAILYSGSGGSGHYIYDRVNNSKIRSNTRNINSIEQVFYNDSVVLKTEIMNLSDNGLVYLYKRLPNK